MGNDVSTMSKCHFIPFLSCHEEWETTSGLEEGARGAQSNYQS